MGTWQRLRLTPTLKRCGGMGFWLNLSADGRWHITYSHVFVGCPTLRADFLMNSEHTWDFLSPLTTPAIIPTTMRRSTLEALLADPLLQLPGVVSKVKA